MGYKFRFSGDAVDRKKGSWKDGEVNLRADLMRSTRQANRWSGAAEGELFLLSLGTPYFLLLSCMYVCMYIVGAMDGSQQGTGFTGRSGGNEKDGNFIAAVKSIRVRNQIACCMIYFLRSFAVRLEQPSKYFHPCHPR